MRQLLNLVTIALPCVPAFFRSRSQQALVELDLRQQLATFAEKGRPPRLTPTDWGFWVMLSRMWSGWKEILVIVQPDTVVRWHRKGFRLYWHAISKPGPGRPPIAAEVRALIRRLANENGWRARKVQAELEKLGICIGLSTVSRYLPKRHSDRAQRQRWNTFLRNHRHDIAAMGFLVVPTAGFRLLYAWFVIGHDRREILQFGVTEHPTSSWIRQQLREAFPHDTSPRFLIFDNASIFSDRVTEAIRNLGVEPRRTAFRSPRQNGVAERWVGSVRRELLDHVIVLNENHLRRLLREYVDYYNADRVHTELRDAPDGRAVQCRPSPKARIIGVPKVGGLHHRYEWQDAA
ncbi:MAG: transposase [Spirochaetaceae bacterium]|nr:transposase [Spirochaetaceae bacterium]